VASAASALAGSGFFLARKSTIWVLSGWSCNPYLPIRLASTHSTRFRVVFGSKQCHKIAGKTHQGAHVWGKSRKDNAVVRQQTAKNRFARALKAINEQCRRMRTWPLRTQHRKLSQMLKGHIAYFGISGNYKRIAALIYQVRRQWRYWLSRRSHKSREWVSWPPLAGALRFPTFVSTMGS
jgi:hypothetical protein